MSHPVIVIGAGICGVSTALWLQRAGKEVLLLDKGAPGSGASFGNAGLLAHWSVDPVTSPTLWRDAPRFLFDPTGPLFIRWPHLPRILPWLVKLMSHATDAKTRQIVANLDPLLYDTVEQHKSLVRGTPIDRWISDSKFSYAYESREAFKADSYSWDMKRSVGLEPSLITGDAVKEEEPILGSAVQCLAVLEGQGHITNPGEYLTELCDHFCHNGGKFIQCEVTDIQQADNRVSSINTTAGNFECSHAVITAGIWSKGLMKKLGINIPMATERGYHLMFENPSILPRNPMIIAAGKFGVTPMEKGLRCAGTVELADADNGAQEQPSKAPLKALRKHAARAFPELSYSDTTEWMGCRPTPSDSTPLIGEIGSTGIYTGFGHQHIGLTAGPKTGRILAQLITGDTPNIDMRPFEPGRFG